MKIILYSKTGCPWSDEIKELFEEKGVNYEERNAAESREYYDELYVKSGQTKSPTLDLDGEIIANTDTDAVERELKRRGIV